MEMHSRPKLTLAGDAVVPSVAVREGVVKTLQITERHFREMFANTPYKFASYDSENLSQVRQFHANAPCTITLSGNRKPKKPLRRRWKRMTA